MDYFKILSQHLPEKKLVRVTKVRIPELFEYEVGMATTMSLCYVIIYKR
jgi:hypothetical protein